MSLASNPLSQQPLTPEQIEKLPELNVGDINACKYEWHDGEAVFFPCVDGKCFPLEQQKFYAEFLCVDLNEHLHHDGAWRVVLRDPVKQAYDKASGLFKVYVPTVIECQFLDTDSDVQFNVRLEHSIDELIKWGLNTAIDLCESAWKQWDEFMTIMAVAESQKIMAAKGEKPRNWDEQYAVD